MGQNGHINNAVPAAIVAVLKYYGEKFTDEQLAQINEDFFFYADTDPVTDTEAKKPQTAHDYQEYLKQMGYDTELITVSSMDVLEKYISAQKLPVLSWVPFPDQPADLDTNMAMVVTGFDEKNGTITFHEYYGGHAQTMPFVEYMNKNKIYSLVIIPKNSEYKNRAAREEFLHRTEAMNRAAPLILQLTFAHLYLNQGNYAWIAIAQKVI
ncbi:MAG TPA: C39 family peptidase, partial [Chitinophagaceae bacterium]|nr:C39 family peptidase [Chitinophagaceae bacterium]